MTCVYLGARIATGYRLDCRVRFPEGARDCSRLHIIRIVLEPTYPMGTGVFFPWSKSVGV
jgi:hypothetical protein